MSNFIKIIIIVVGFLFPFITEKLRNKFDKSPSIVSKYKTHSILIIFLAVFILFFCFGRNTDNVSNKETIADGFTIEDYTVKLDVSSSNVVDVTEIITANFYEDGHHGIRKFIPEWLEYTGKDGVTVSRLSKVDNLYAVNDKYNLDTFNGKDRITIGDSLYTTGIGSKTYTIKYTYDMGNDIYKGYDEFIFHTFGDYWGTKINNAKVEVTMPKDFDINNISFFGDKYRKNNITSYIDYNVIGNTLYVEVLPTYDLYKSLTIDIELPDNYFINTSSNNYGILSFILCLFIISSLIITFVKWLKYGKDYKKALSFVEFYPPDNLDCSEIGYIYKKEGGKKLVSGLIVQLASKGYIKIDDIPNEKSKRNKIIITNLCPINMDLKINRKVTVHKIKSATSKKDKEIISMYFNNNNYCIITKDINDFLHKTENLVKKGFIKIESDSINEYSVTAINRIKDELTNEAFKGKKPMSENEKIVYDKLFEYKDVNILNEDYEFYKVFDAIFHNLFIKYNDIINETNSYKNMAFTSNLLFISSIYYCLSYYYIKDLNPKYFILYNIAFISLIIMFILTILMKRKTMSGEHLSSRIEGFKKYLETAEKDKINSFANKYPNYFFDILPYAYVLGVSKVWINKFNNIPVPNNNTFDYYNMTLFDDLGSSIYTPSGSSSSDGCGGGGGCSSCGGGSSW